MNKRIQRKRTKGWRMPPNTAYVGRGTVWGNPFKVGGTYETLFGPKQSVKVESKQQCLELYRAHVKKMLLVNPPSRIVVKGHIVTVQEGLDILRGYDLACFCPLDQPCHADILLELCSADSK